MLSFPDTQRKSITLQLTKAEKRLQIAKDKESLLCSKGIWPSIPFGDLFHMNIPPQVSHLPFSYC